jgi:hypothetical protein
VLAADSEIAGPFGGGFAANVAGFGAASAARIESLAIGEK